MTKLVFIHVPIRNMYFLSGMEGFKKSEGRSTRGASSLQYWLRPPPQNWMRPYDSCSSAPTALMKKLSTANLLSIHVLILRIFVFGGATRIVGAGRRQSQIWLCTVVLLANPLPGASGLEKLTIFLRPSTFYVYSSFPTNRNDQHLFGRKVPLVNLLCSQRCYIVAQHIVYQFEVHILILNHCPFLFDGLLVL